MDSILGNLDIFSGPKYFCPHLCFSWIRDELCDKFGEAIEPSSALPEFALGIRYTLLRFRSGAPRKTNLHQISRTL